MKTNTTKTHTLEAEVADQNGNTQNLSIDLDAQTAASLGQVIHHALTLTALQNRAFDVPENTQVNSIKLSAKQPAAGGAKPAAKKPAAKKPAAKKAK